MAGTASSRVVLPPARERLTPPDDVQRGMALYQARCTACHTIDSNGIGPAHRGVVGRRAGSLAGYKYSDELAQSRLRWTPQTLNTWLEDPEELVPGQRMGFQVENAQERADLIAYLVTLRQALAMAVGRLLRCAHETPRLFTRQCCIDRGNCHG